MLKKILPIVLLLVGSGAGVGAGIFLRPAVDPAAEMASEAHAGKDAAQSDDHAAPNGAKAKDDHGDDHGGDHGADPDGLEYVKLNNQFVVPVVKDQNVAALVVMALSLEVPVGSKDEVYRREPKVRDSFLQVLFDHANVGGFDGAFTDANTMDVLRRALREVAQRDLGREMVKDVLILEIARQDY